MLPSGVGAMTVAGLKPGGFLRWRFFPLRLGLGGCGNRCRGTLQGSELHGPSVGVHQVRHSVRPGIPEDRQLRLLSFGNQLCGNFLDHVYVSCTVKWKECQHSAITLLGPATTSFGHLVAGADLLRGLDGRNLLQLHFGGVGDKPDLGTNHGGANRHGESELNFRGAILGSEGGGSSDDGQGDDLLHGGLRCL